MDRISSSETMEIARQLRGVLTNKYNTLMQPLPKSLSEIYSFKQTNQRQTFALKVVVKRKTRVPC